MMVDADLDRLRSGPWQSPLPGACRGKEASQNANRSSSRGNFAPICTGPAVVAGPSAPRIRFQHLYSFLAIVLALPTAAPHLG